MKILNWPRERETDLASMIELCSFAQALSLHTVSPNRQTVVLALAHLAAGFVAHPLYRESQGFVSF